MTHGLLFRVSRRAHVFATALAVFLALKATQTLLALLTPPGWVIRIVWSFVHSWCARRFLALARSRRGFWVKCCQYVASRGDVLPAEYPAILTACLDACPADDPDTIRKAVEGELRGKSIKEVFEGFDPARPIASASIAQVHTARLRDTGRPVVLKVQHPGVREFLMQDLRDLSAILAWLSVLEPEFDLRPMMEAWIDMVPLETDFRQEIANVKRVRDLFARAPEDLRTIARVPEPVEELSTESLFVMEFVDGCKISDLEKNSEGIDMERLVMEITKSFALQLHISGNFNGDPHPGNFLVDRAVPGAVPVLLDFGISVPLDMKTKLGFSRLVLAAVDNDSFSLLQSFADMGIHLNRADPAASMELIKFMFRTTVPQEQTVEESHAFRKRMLQHRENSKTENTVLRLKTQQSDCGDDSVYKRPLIDAYPGHLVFFMRSLALLRGLATTLGVRHAYLPVLRTYAAQALWDACPEAERAKEVVYQVPKSTRAKRPRTLSYRRARKVQSRLDKVLTLLADHDLLVGCQVAVYHRDELIVDTAAGRMGKHNPRPVLHNSLFNGFSASEALVSILFAQMQDEYLVDRTDFVGIRWPQFAVNGKEKTTIEHLLSHRTGIHAFAAKDLSLSRLHDDRKGILGDLMDAEPAYKPGKRHEHRFYDLNFGYIAAGMVEHVTGECYGKRLERLTEALGVADECYCGNMPVPLRADTPTSRVATLSNSILEDLELGARAQGGTQNAETAAGDDNLGKLYSGDDTMGKAKNAIETILSHQGAAGSDMAGLDREALEHLPLYFLEPAFFNHPLMRASCVPAANAHFSARAIAKVFAVLANDGEVRGTRILERGRVAEMMRPHYDGRDRGRRDGASGCDRGSSAAGGAAYGAGMRLYDTVKDGRVRERSAIGCIGIGGTMAFAIPHERFAIAITVNKLNFVSAAAAAIVILVSRTLGVSMPVEFATMETKAKKIREQNRRNGVEADLFQSMKDALTANVASSASFSTRGRS